MLQFVLWLVFVLLPANVGAVCSAHNWDNLDESEKWTKAHNYIRCRHGVPQDLEWTKKLATEADSWAGDLCQLGSLKHDPDSNDGENLSGGNNPVTTPGNWANDVEISNYDPATGGCKPKAGGGFTKCSHFTQVVWAATTKVGCGVRSNCKNDIKVSVCRYSATGNDGTGRKNVESQKKPEHSEIFCCNQVFGTWGNNEAGGMCHDLPDWSLQNRVIPRGRFGCDQVGQSCALTCKEEYPKGTAGTLKCQSNGWAFSSDCLYEYESGCSDLDGGGAGTYNCAWYVKNKACARYGNLNTDAGGLAANDACCFCGGGSQGGTGQANPVDGKWSGWPAFSTCSANCGAGTKSRSKTCIPPTGGGAPCNGNPPTQTEACNQGTCSGSQDHYVRKGNGANGPTCRAASQKAKVRCCVNGNCPSNWPNSKEQNNVCGTSMFKNAAGIIEQCKVLNWNQANAFCSRIGGRLCANNELKAGKGSGCSFDVQPVWTSGTCNNALIADSLNAEGSVQKTRDRPLKIGFAIIGALLILCLVGVCLRRRQRAGSKDMMKMQDTETEEEQFPDAEAPTEGSKDGETGVQSGMQPMRS